jgi:FkbM family methyltransferase
MRIRILGNARHVIACSYQAVRTKHPLGRVRLLLLYWGYCLRSLFGGAKEARLAGLRIETPNYRHFIDLFEEIFLGRCYLFTSKNPAPRIIDAGGNIGMSVCYFKTLYPAARIDVFEADPATAEILRRNVEHNGWHDCRVHSAAVSETDGELTFYSRTDDETSSFNSTVAERMGSSAHEAIKVKAVRLSPYLDGPIDLLKVDVEGAEQGVFRELAASGRLQQVDQMFIEYHHHIRKDSDDFGPFLSLLEAQGFGYAITTWLQFPTWKGRFQDFVIFAYRK